MLDSNTGMGSMEIGVLPLTHMSHHPVNEYLRKDRMHMGQRNRFTPLKHEHLESADASASIIQSYNQNERRRMINVMKEEIKYFMGSIVPKTLRPETDTKFYLQRSSGFLT